MKRTVFFAAILLLLLACTVAAFAATPVTEGDWKYEVLNPRSESPSVRIVRYNPANDPPEILAVPEQLGGYPVTEIKSFAFTTYRELENYQTEKIPGPKTIILPAGLETIGQGGFSFEELQEFRIENGLRYETRDGVLFDKETGTLLVYPKGRKALSYAVPEGTLVIGSDAFNWPVWLCELHLPDSVRTIEKDAVSVSGLRINIPEGIETIEPGAIVHASEFTSMSPRYQVTGGMLVDTEEKKLVSVPDAYEGKTLIIPEGVEVIGERAVSSVSCSGVSFPSTLRVIEDQNWFSHIASGILELPEGLESIGGSFDPGDVKTLSFPASLRSIGSHSVTFCDNLETVVFREGLESIGRDAFSHNENLESVTLPASLKEIGAIYYDPNAAKAFRECPKLTLRVWPDSVGEQFCRKAGNRYQYVFAGLWQADPAEAGEVLSLQGVETITFRLEKSALILTYRLDGVSHKEVFLVEWTKDRLCMKDGYMEYELTDEDHLVLKMNGAQLYLTKAEDPV